MVFILIIRDYLHWHYTGGVVDYIRVWSNFLRFFYNFFSIKLLLSTLFSVWKRMDDETEVSLTDFYGFFSRAVVNIAMRLIGFFVRTIFIFIGIIALAITFVVGLTGFALWFILPIGTILLMVAGVHLLIFSKT